MNSKVVEDNKGLHTFTLLLEVDQEVLEVVRIVGFANDIIVHQPSELTYASDDSHRRSSILDKLETHLGDNPTLAHLLPQVEGGLIDENYFFEFLFYLYL